MARRGEVRPGSQFSREPARAANLLHGRLVLREQRICRRAGAALRKPELPSEGACRCGQVRVRISAPPILTMACHCRGCQKMGASAFLLSAAIPTEGFEVLSWMFTRFVPQLVNLRVTMLDDAAWFEPFMETWTKTKLPWAITGAVAVLGTARQPSYPLAGITAAWRRNAPASGRRVGRRRSIAKQDDRASEALPTTLRPDGTIQAE